MTHFEELKELLPEAAVKSNECMTAHTSFKIGGPADVLVIADKEDDIRKVCAYASEKNVPLTVMGNGTNMLVSDNGIEGIVLAIKGTSYEFKFTDAEGGKVRAKVPAGVLLSVFAKQAAKAGFTGTECLSGIPGAVGGAVAMNAGAYGGEIKDIIVSADVLDKDLKLITLSKDELELSYRNSAVLKNGYIVISAEFELSPDNPDEILARMEDFNSRRKEKQPLNYPSAGSTFKRPEGYFAGKLIQDAGLRGYEVGMAKVSEKHCGFVINTGGASASDVMRLIADVKEKVYENSGVMLEPEVRIIGRP